MKAQVDKDKCISCGTCVSLCPQCFEMKNGFSYAKEGDCECSDCSLEDVAQACPAQAISVSEE